MCDKEDPSAIIGRASDPDVPECITNDYPDMSRDLPMQNAIDVVYKSTISAKEKNERLLDDAKNFAKVLREELLNRSLITKDDDRETSLLFFDAVPKFAQQTFIKLRNEIPLYGLLRSELKTLIRRISATMQRSADYSEDEYSDLADKLMVHVWPNPIRPYIKNMLLRETAIQSINLVELWHSAVETGELTKEEAVEQLKYCAEKANNVSKLFTKDNAVYFCKDIENTNELDELQRLWMEEEGDTLTSWERKHGAFVKASLMYAIHVIDGTICRKETNMVMKEIRRRIESISIDMGGDAVLLNPTDEGEVGPNSLILDKVDYNSKDPESEYLKFIIKLLSDDIAPDANSTSDRTRFRGHLREDPRESHPSFANYSVKVAEIASATKFLAIVMMRFGTTVDKRNIRNSIDTGQGINDKSGRVHRALQWKGSIFVDKYPDGSVRKKAKSYMYESQALCYVPEGNYEADVAEYRRKKILKAQKVLGVGINFAADTLNLCDVFVNRYRFPHDTPEMRELAEFSFGQKMFKVPFMKEMVASKILGRLVSDDVDTKRIVEELFQQRSASKKLKQTLIEMQSYLGELKRHYLIMRSFNLSCIVSDTVKDEQFVDKVCTFHKYLSEGQLVETTDINDRIDVLQREFEEYALLHGLIKYDEENYSHIGELLKDIHYVAHEGPSGLDAKLRRARQMYLNGKGDAVYVDQTTLLDQLSLFGDDSETFPL